MALGPGGESSIYVAPLNADEQAEDLGWIRLTDDLHFDWKPCWAPNGEWVYFGAIGAGFGGIRAQRVHSETKQPIGEPKKIYHVLTGRYHPPRLAGSVGFSAARDRLIFTMVDTTGNVWLAEPAKAATQPQ
jgi:hypothetical protein